MVYSPVPPPPDAGGRAGIRPSKYGAGAGNARSPNENFRLRQAEIGEELGSYEYTLTQEMLDNFRASVNDPMRCSPRWRSSTDATAFAMVYDDQTGGVNAGNEVEFFNPPIPGKKIRVTGRIADKYMRRDKPYMVIEATAVDEDGRLLEKLRTYQMKKPDEVGKKWHPQG